MNYRREIDGLRAIALIPVVLFHAGYKWFAGGFVGVDVFFVISGYLITSLIVAEREKGTFSLVHFYRTESQKNFAAAVVRHVGVCALCVVVDDAGPIDGLVEEPGVDFSVYLKHLFWNGYELLCRRCGGKAALAHMEAWRWRNNTTWCGLC